MAKGYSKTKLPCATCKVDSWHYTDAFGRVSCVLCKGTIVKPSGRSIEAVNGISAEPGSTKNGFIDPATKAQTKRDIYAKPEGWHRAFCDKCQRDTFHYAGKTDEDKAHCTEHIDVDRVFTGRFSQSMMLMHLVPEIEAPTEGELRVLNRMPPSPPKSRNTAARTDLQSSIFFAPEERTPAVQADPDKLVCTFCQTQIDKIHATSEKVPYTFRVVEPRQDIVTKEITLVERLKTSQREIHACPQCCLQIKNPSVVVRV